MRTHALRVEGFTLLLLALSPPAYSQGTRIDLGDIAAGGDGSGTASPDVIGVHPDTGFFESFFSDGPIGIADGIALQPVNPSVSAFIDSVFIIEREEMPINTAGARFLFQPDDVLQPALTWGQILNNRIGGEVTPISIGGVPFESGVGIHATAGITYDLTELRDVYGERNVGEVAAFAGMGDSIYPECPGRGFVRTYLILSDEERILASASHVASSGGESLRLPIPPEAMFLTLASGAGAPLDRDPRFFCNSGTFGDALILPKTDGLFRRGDSDTNGAVNITDSIRILNVLFLGIGTITCDDAADSDDNGAVDLTDAVALLNMNFLWLGWSPPPPGIDTCGPDPTGDSIDCAAYEADC